MDINRKHWNDGHQKLRQALAVGDHAKAVEQFFIQHAMVHSQKMSRMNVWSFEDELWQGMSDEAFRAIPPREEHSIAWVIFHITRIEDITMNMLVANSPQLYWKDNWAKKLKSTISHSANKMDKEAVVQLSAKLSMDALLEYRVTVGRCTRKIIKGIGPKQWKQQVDSVRLKRVLDEGAVTPEAIEIINYWGKRTTAGLILMPPTRHNFLHLNEAMRIKRKVIK